VSSGVSFASISGEVSGEGEMASIFESDDKFVNAKRSFWSRNSQPAPAPAEESTSKRRKRSWTGFFRDISLYLLVYVVISGVSIGPLFWVWFSAVYVDGPKWFARLYMPLVFLCEIFPPLGWLINAWVNWWIL